MNDILVWGHRGASGYKPENTLSAFQEAVNQKADGVELDIQLTKDGEIVVIHDETVNRTTNGIGFVKDFTLSEIQALNANVTHPEVEEEHIPTMKEVFELLKPTNLTINIELKTGIFDYEGIEEKIVALTQEEGFENRVLYSSFNHYSILRIQELDSNAKTAFLYADGPIDMPTYGKAYHVDALHPDIVNLKYPNFMEECCELGLDVNVWTVNSKEQILYAKKKGVHAIIGNYPDRIRKYLEEE